MVLVDPGDQEVRPLRSLGDTAPRVRDLVSAQQFLDMVLQRLAGARPAALEGSLSDGQDGVDVSFCRVQSPVSRCFSSVRNSTSSVVIHSRRAASGSAIGSTWADWRSRVGGEDRGGRELAAELLEEVLEAALVGPADLDPQGLQQRGGGEAEVLVARLGVDGEQLAAVVEPEHRPQLGGDVGVSRADDRDERAVGPAGEHEVVTAASLSA